MIRRHRQLHRHGPMVPRQRVYRRGVAVWTTSRYRAATDDIPDISGNPIHPAQLGSTNSGDTNDPTLLPYEGEQYLYLPGGSGNFASAPDTAALSITGDLTLAAYIEPDDFTPAASQIIIAKYVSAGDERGYEFLLNTNGTLALGISTDGTSGNTTFDNSSETIPTVPQWVATQLDVSETESSFWTSTDPRSTPIADITWVELGIASVTAPASIFDNAQLLEVGSAQAGTGGNFVGKISRAVVLSALRTEASASTIEFDADFTTQPVEPFATFTEGSSNAATVTINRSATGLKSTMVDRTMFLLGTDDFFEVANEPKTTNLVTNPQFGVDTTGWTTSGTNTIEQVDLATEGITTEGLPSGVTTALKCTFVDNNTMAGFAITVTAAEHFFSGHVFIPTAYDGEMRCTDAGTFAGATGAQSADANSSLKDQWQRIDFDITVVGGDLAGQMIWTANQGPPTAGRFLYLTGEQIELAGAATDFVSGASPNGYWNGTAHASTSTERADLDFAPDDSLTVVYAGRTYDNSPASNEHFIGKKDAGGALAGWAIYVRSSTERVRAIVADGTNLPINELDTQLTNGVAFIVGNRRDVLADTVQSFIDGATDKSPTVDSTTATLANAFALRIGADGDTAQSFTDGEFYAAALFHEALTDEEVRQVGLELVGIG
jgi:hypothetical protein